MIGLNLLVRAKITLFLFCRKCQNDGHPTLDTTTTASTTTTTWTASSNQLTEKEKCELNPVQLHVAKRGKLIRQGSDSVIIRVKQPIPSNSNYTALVIFDRQVCGIDFLRQLYNYWESGVK